MELLAEVSICCVHGGLRLLHDETNSPCADEVVTRPVGGACRKIGMKKRIYSCFSLTMSSCTQGSYGDDLFIRRQVNK